MMDYREAYFTLFNAATDAMAFMQQRNFGMACRVLARAQIEAEGIIISQPDGEEEDGE